MKNLNTLSLGTCLVMLVVPAWVANCQPRDLDGMPRDPRGYVVWLIGD